MIKIYDYKEVENEEIFARNIPQDDVSDVVSNIVADVRDRGDEALYEYSSKYDGAQLTSLVVSDEEIEEAFCLVDEEFLEVLREASENIRAFHERQSISNFLIHEREGVLIGQKIEPIKNVGLYVPGGTASYPSTVLMDSIPAKIAGCKNIVITTPPSSDGKVSPVILAAAKIAGVDKIYKVGGAQAIAALAYGTESIPKVDKIVGPGNAYVAEAKKQVFGRVSIDMIAGPSEILVIADETCDARHVAADMLSQAEHDKNASAVLVTDSEQLAEQVADEIETQLETLPRRDIARASIDDNGKIIVCENLSQAIDIANEIAPEHLEICVDSPFDYLDSIKHAGSIFMGKSCPEALGDYFAGPNHTLPTSGTARFSSPLGVDDFVKRMQFTYYSADALQNVSEKVALFAKREGLDAHARSVLIRNDKS